MIKKGKKFSDEPWIGKKVSCSFCEGRFQLEAGDKVRGVYNNMGGNYCVVKCPNCKGEIKFT